MKVMITKPAQRRLKQIDEYYGRKGNNSYSRKLRKEIREKSKLLSEKPEIGQEEEYLKGMGQGHRYVMIAKLFRLIYLIANPFIFITDIFDTRQDPKEMKP